MWSALLGAVLALRGTLAARHASISKWDESTYGYLIKTFLYHDRFPAYQYAVFALFLVPILTLLKDFKLEEEKVRKYNGILLLTFIPPALIYLLFVYGVYLSPPLTFWF
jgi:hypothetical protein